MNLGTFNVHNTIVFEVHVALLQFKEDLRDKIGLLWLFKGLPL